MLGLDEPAGETATRLPLVVGAALTEKPELEISPLAKEKASVVPLSSRRRRPALVAGVATASVTVAVLFAGTAAAAFTGSLPAPLQRVAHSLVGAPAPDAVDDLAVTTAEATGSPQSARPSTPSSPARSDHGLATGPSAPALAGLCHAFAGRTPSDGVSRSTAYAALRSAAAKAGQSVDDYCSAHHVAPTPRGSGHGLANAPGQRPGHHGNGGQPGQGAGARHGSGPGNGNGNSNVKRGGTGAGLSSTTGSGHGRGPGGQSGPSHVGARGGSGTASSGHASHSAVH